MAVIAAIVVFWNSNRFAAKETVCASTRRFLRESAIVFVQHTGQLPVHRQAVLHHHRARKFPARVERRHLDL